MTVSNMPRAATKLVPYRIKKIGKENDTYQFPRLTRDEKPAKNLNIPYSVQFIITCSMEEFNDILNNKSLDNEQISLCRNIRRRGKNKVIVDGNVDGN
jgi:predicted DNA-binding ArsR family transcriptional regulator